MANYKYPNTVLSQAKGELSAFLMRVHRIRYLHLLRWLPYSAISLDIAAMDVRRYMQEAADNYADARARMHILDEDQYYA